MPLPPTTKFGLHQYESTDDFDFAEVSDDYETIDRLAAPTVCTSGTRPNTELFVGREIWETDSLRFYKWDGTQWVFQANGADFLTMLNPPRCKAWQSPATQSIPNNVRTAMALNAEEYKSDATMHDNAVTNTRIKAPKAGLYMVAGYASFIANATGLRQLSFAKNGVDVTTQPVLMTSDVVATVRNFQLSAEIQLAANDYIELMLTQTSGAGLALASSTVYGNYLSLRWLCP